MKKGGKSSMTKVAKKAAPKSKKTVAKKKAVKKVVKKSANTTVKKAPAKKKAVKKTTNKVAKKSVKKKAIKKTPVKKKVTKKVTKKITKKTPVKKKIVKKTTKKTVKKAPTKKKAQKSTKASKKKTVKKSTKVSSESKILPASIEDLPPPPTFEEFTEDDYTTQYTDVSQDKSVSNIGYKPIQDVSDENDTPVSLDEQTTQIDEHVPSMQEIEEVLGKPKKKKSFFAKLFGKKDKTESEIIADTTDDKKVDEKLEDITHQTQHDLDSLSVENEKNAQSEIDDAHARQENYVANLRRRLDMEMQERQQHVQEAHAQISEREAELEQRHQQILAREKELVKHADKYDELKTLESQIEDKHITVEKKHQEIEQLRAELAAKEEDLASKEDELVQREQELKDKELMINQTTPEPMSAYETVEDDDDDFMYRKKEVNATVTKPVVDDEPTVDVMTSKARDIHVQLQQAYTALHNSDVTDAKDIYVKVTAMYKELAQEQGQDAQLYQDILDLYKDIKLAMVQSI